MPEAMPDTLPDPSLDTLPDHSEEHAPAAAAETPLASSLTAAGLGNNLTGFAGVQTIGSFGDPEQELGALLRAAGVYDLGWRTRLRITGEDRVRWLNGMVTNTVRDLRENSVHYTFLLNAQGRIQGDGDVYALADALLLATDRAQAPKLMQHLDHFIIMDDVELATDGTVTALGISGPAAPAVLAKAGFSSVPKAGTCLQHGGCLLAQERPGEYTLWLAAAEVRPLWEQLQSAGAAPCGVEAVEAQRIFSGVPRYGADMVEKTLAQETGQGRALNFSKGCYLGQEIVERVRSRATVHRGIRCLVLEGAPAMPGTSLFVAGKPGTAVGELTSVATLAWPGASGIYALATVRTEAMDLPLEYSGGVARVLPRAPLQTI